ncbi:MAG: hypothetical protein GY934_22400, partial [Gammaproteobacteria bacterium]|nr:hypothetical protein [Gammaproteobacteria bacterium]
MPDVQDILTSSAEPDYGIDFPVSIYERPMHAMSNLLLRGNVDAATRAIFQPDTLSPTEMKTLTNRFAGPNPSPLIKTILDVATNPLVIGGLIGGYLLYPAVGGATLAKVFSGMRAGVPKTGLLGDFVGASYSRLRHLVKPAVKGKPAQSMLGAIQDVNQSIGHFVERHQLWRAEAYGHMGTSVGKGGAAGRRIAAMSQGWNKGLDSDLRHVLGKYMDDVPMTPGLQGKMSRDELTAVGKIKKGLAKLYDEVIPENMRATFEAEAKKRGTTLGKERENFFPHTGTPNELRRKIIQYGEYDPVTKKGVVNYRKPLADNLKRRKGWNIPDPVELREMEAAGDITKGFTDKLMQAVDLDVAEFTTKLRAAVAQAKPTQEGMTAAINEAAKSMDISGHYVKEAASNIFSVVASPTGKSMAGQSLDDVITWAGKMLRTPGTYSMDLDPVLTRYATKMGQSYGWLTAKATGSAKTLGQTADDLIDYFRTTTGPNGKILMPAGGPVDHYLTQQLIP